MSINGQETIIITGNRGGVGKPLEKGFIDLGFDVYGIARTPSPNPKHLSADITKPGELKLAFDMVLGKVKAVLHIAGNPNRFATWDEVWEPNVEGTRNVLEAARDHHIGTVIYAGSNHAMGMWEGGLDPHLHEQRRPHVYRFKPLYMPDGPYGWSKVMGEIIGREFHDLYGMRFISIRIGTLRPDDDPTTDERWWRSTWLSHRDAIALFRAATEADHIGYGIYNGVSNNPRRFWYIGNALRDLGWVPQDNGARERMARLGLAVVSS